MNKSKSKTIARLATLDELIKNIIPSFLAPVPTRETLRCWFDGGGIPHFKTNPNAKRGGGAVYYSVRAVEKFLRTRTMNCHIHPAPADTALLQPGRTPLTKIAASESNQESGEKH